MNNLVTAASPLALLFVPVVFGLVIRRLGTVDGVSLRDLLETLGFVVGTSPTPGIPEPDFVPWRFDQLSERIGAADGASLRPADVLGLAA